MVHCRISITFAIAYIAYICTSISIKLWHVTVYAMEMNHTLKCAAL